MPWSGSPLIPLRFERRSHWPRPESQPSFSLRTVLLFLGLAAVGATLGNSVAWIDIYGANPWQWRAIVSQFLPYVILTPLLQWAVLSPNRVGVRLLLTAIVFATFLAARVVAAARVDVNGIDLALGIANPLAVMATMAAVFGVARWAGWRWVSGETPQAAEPSERFAP